MSSHTNEHPWSPPTGLTRHDRQPHGGSTPTGTKQTGTPAKPHASSPGTSD